MTPTRELWVHKLIERRRAEDFHMSQTRFSSVCFPRVRVRGFGQVYWSIAQTLFYQKEQRGIPHSPERSQVNWLHHITPYLLVIWVPAHLHSLYIHTASFSCPDRLERLHGRREILQQTWTQVLARSLTRPRLAGMEGRN